ncbi:MAG: glycosyltransferase family 9 protein [Nitrospirae bacterium]|nr:glycosyltransferase family 9 protein [Nitrospirota bacterium]
MNKIGFLKGFDSFIAKPLVPLVHSFVRGYKWSPLNIHNISGRRDRKLSILFIRPGGIGDAVLLLPSINCLKMAIPEASICVLCENRNAGIFTLTKAIDHLYLYDKGIDLIKCLSSTYDVVVDTEQWHRLSAIVAALTKAQVRLGFDTNNRSLLFSHPIPYRHDEYEADSFASLIRPLTEQPLHFDHDRPFIEPSVAIPADFSMARGDLVAIFPGASVRERRWGAQNYGEVASAISAQGYTPVIVGANSDRADAAEIVRRCGKCIDLTGKTTLMETAAVLGASRLLIGADSGLLHVAVGVGTPTVSIFGAGLEKKWAPRGKAHKVLNARVDCSPCTLFGYTPPCKNKIKCLTAISVDEVIGAVVSALAVR